MATYFGTPFNDSITGSTSADTISGFGGNDTISGGNGNDYLFGGAGNDVLQGDSGDDTIQGDAGDDSISGGDGNDSLLGLAGNDTLLGDAGNDALYGGIGNDVLQGDSGDDTLQGDDGDDSISGGDGNDRLRGSAGNDTLVGEAGDDSITGGLGNDNLDGGTGNDTLDGLGGGADVLTGGAGDDLFILSGGFGDTIHLADFGAGETAGSNTTQTDNDFVDLTPWYNASTLALYNSSYGTSFTNALQAMQHDAADGVLDFISLQSGLAVTFTLAGTGLMDTEHTGVTCFTSGTMIATRAGSVPVEELAIGDGVLTLDDGHQEIRWIGSRTLSRADLAAQPNLRPIRIRAGALGEGQPAQDLVVSPQHRILVRSAIAQRMFGQREVLIAAKHLLAIDGIDIALDLEEVTYWHFLFDRHQLVFSNGAVSESLFTGPEALKSVSAEARAEILALFPELAQEAPEAPAPIRHLVRGRAARSFTQRVLRNDQKLLA